MPTIRIDGREATIHDGETILEVARRLGIEIPTLCHLAELKPEPSCMVCMVKVVPQERVRDPLQAPAAERVSVPEKRAPGTFVPACATIATDGMEIESETAEVRKMRRGALELLLAEHLGDCEGPCRMTCPTFMDIPGMLRAVTAGDDEAARRIVYRHMALPGVLACVCPAPCEKVCRRRQSDGPVAIREAHGYVAELQASAAPQDLPEASGKHVVIIGSGPCGLAAAYHLLCDGHAVEIIDRRSAPGGSLRDLSDAELPPPVLEADLRVLRRLGCGFRTGTVTTRAELESLSADAIVLALGTVSEATAGALGLDYTGKGLDANTSTGHVAGRVFAAGACVRPMKLAVQAVAAGRRVAACVSKALDAARTGSRREPPDSAQYREEPSTLPFNTRMHKLTEEEIRRFVAETDRHCNSGPGPHAQAAARCLHCDCRKPHECRLRRLAQQYEANPTRYRAKGREFEIESTHPEIVFEVGKCIDCGICVRLCELERDVLGLTFIGRGFDVRVSPPFGASVQTGLGKLARELAAACPTGALARRARIYLPV